MRNNVRDIFLPTMLLMAIFPLFAGCGSGRPMPTHVLEGVLPDKFTDWALMSVVRNGGGPPYSEVIGHYRAIDEKVPQGLGAGGEIRISVQDWGQTSESPRLPVTGGGESLEFRGLKYAALFTPGNRSYQLRIPVGERIHIMIEFDDTGADNQMDVLEAINWDYLEKILPSWEGLE